MAHEITVPSVGESITEVYIGRWHKAVGDTVQEGDVLVELESDKAMIELPAPYAGTLTQVLKGDGDEAQVGEVIALMEAGEVPAGDDGGPAAQGDATPATQDGTSATDTDTAPPPAAASGGEDGAGAAATTPAPVAAQLPPTGVAVSTIMPAAQRLLDQYGLDAEGIPATGFGGRLLKDDVQRYIHSLAAEVVAAGPVETDSKTVQAGPIPGVGASRAERTERMSPIRRRIAANLVQAQQTAALLTTFNEIDMSRVMNMRRTHQDTFTDKHGTRLGVMSFFVKASVAALQLIPEVNAEIRDDTIVYKDYCDIGIAVGGGRGLVVPVVRNAERLGFAEIESTIADFAKRAQDNTLGIDEMQGGTFTISNGGVYGSLLSTPIVNPPQSGILGLHRIQERPVVVDGEIVIRPMMYIALTYDHRIVDGREAVTFLKHIKELLEDPERMLLEI